MSYTTDLMAFLDESPVNFLACSEVCRRLEDAGFSRLDPRDPWNLHPGDRCYTVKNNSAVMAFVVGSDPAAGYHIISAHSDSPGFRIKPNAEIKSGGAVKLNTEVYGGPILYTWFDRPLSVAGRVVLRSDDPLNPTVATVRVRRPILVIPHLAIHFNRAVNEGNPLSKQKDMLPVLCMLGDSADDTGNRLVTLIADEIGANPDDILDFDLSLYDTTPACLTGLNNEFINSGRLDDLSMVHAAITSLIAESGHDARATRVAAIFDNEETGSGTKQGAASPLLDHTLRRINASLGGDGETYLRAIAASFMISADNAHAIHPNYPDKHDPTNHPVINGGPVIKINANCKYMTDADSAAVYAEICRRAGVPVQRFVNHSDVAGGSTLGNILTSQINLRGVDMGAPIWAMHSCRETAGAADHDMIIASFREFMRL